VYDDVLDDIRALIERWDQECEGPLVEGFGTSEIVVHCGSIEGRHNVWCQELAWIAVGRRFTMNRVA
jgi:hypothetical protein